MTEWSSLYTAFFHYLSIFKAILVTKAVYLCCFGDDPLDRETLQFFVSSVLGRSLCVKGYIFHFNLEHSPFHFLFPFFFNGCYSIYSIERGRIFNYFRYWIYYGKGLPICTTEMLYIPTCTSSGPASLLSSRIFEKGKLTNALLFWGCPHTPELETKTFQRALLWCHGRPKPVGPQAKSKGKNQHLTVKYTKLGWGT